MPVPIQDGLWGQGERFFRSGIRVECLRYDNTLGDFTTESFRGVKLTFADQTFADGHLIIKSPMDRKEGPVGP